MHKLLIGTSSAILLAASAASPAMAQATNTTGPGSIANVTCGDIASLPVAYQAALIYYAAGYQDGLTASTSGTGGASTSSSGDAAASASASAELGSSAASGEMGSSAASSESTGGSGAMIGGLGLQAQDIVSACASSPTSLLTEVISSNGGSAGNVTGTGATGASSTEMGTSSELGGASSELGGASASSSELGGGAMGTSSELGGGAMSASSSELGGGAMGASSTDLSASSSAQ